MKKFQITLSVMFILLSGNTFASRLCISPDDSYQWTGFAWLTGGYENLVATGKTQEGLRVVLGGGNHASGDLGATFPWAYAENGELRGIGFNDMMFSIGDRKFYHDRKFIKQTTKDIVDRDLVIEMDRDGKIETLAMNVPVKEYVSGKTYSLTMEINVVQAGRTIKRREGLKRFDNDYLLSIIKRHFNVQLDRNLGLALEEFPLSLDPERESYIRLVDETGTPATYRLSSFFGALEKSFINIYASEKRSLRVHMQYDYIALYPEDEARCGKNGFVGYISGILNKNQRSEHSWNIIEDILGASLPTLQSEMHKFIKRYGSSGFFFDRNGNETKMHRIQKYNQIKTLSDVSNIPELNLKRAGSSKLIELTHRMGPGTFHRSLVKFMGYNGCNYYGMLEIQTENK